MDCSPPGSCVHGILQARILEWVAISFSRGSPQPKDRTLVFYFCIAGRFFTHWVTWEALMLIMMYQYLFKNCDKYTIWMKDVNNGVWDLYTILTLFSSVQFISVAQSYPTLWDPMNHSIPGLPVHHQLLEFTQTHVHRVGDAIQPSHPLSSPSPAFNLSQHQGLFKWVSSLHQVAKVLELQLQHQSFQWTPRTDLL